MTTANQAYNAADPLADEPDDIPNVTSLYAKWGDGNRPVELDAQQLGAYLNELDAMITRTREALKPIEERMWSFPELDPPHLARLNARRYALIAALNALDAIARKAHNARPPVTLDDARVPLPPNWQQLYPPKRRQQK
jgi:hypothetical protein